MTLERERIKQVLDLFVEVVSEHRASKDEFVYFTKLDWPLDYYYYYYFFFFSYIAGRRAVNFRGEPPTGAPHSLRVVKNMFRLRPKKLILCRFVTYTITVKHSTFGVVGTWSIRAADPCLKRSRQSRKVTVNMPVQFYSRIIRWGKFGSKCFHHLCTICVRIVMVLKKYTFSN